MTTGVSAGVSAVPLHRALGVTDDELAAIDLARVADASGLGQRLDPDVDVRFRGGGHDVGPRPGVHHADVEGAGHRPVPP